MAKNKIVVDFTSVESYAKRLENQSENFNSDLNNSENLTTSFSSLISSGLIPTYFSDYSSYANKISTFTNTLAEKIMKYHNNLIEIEGYVKEGEKLLENEKDGGKKTDFTPGGITIPGKPNVSTETSTEEAIPETIKIPKAVILESGYGKLSIIQPYQS